MLGHKSIVKELVIDNFVNPKTPYFVKVQANKNYGICDIIYGTKIPQEIVNDRTGRKKTIKKFFFVRRITEALPIFLGQQYNDPIVLQQLDDVLTNILNSK